MSHEMIDGTLELGEIEGDEIDPLRIVNALSIETNQA